MTTRPDGSMALLDVRGETDVSREPAQQAASAHAVHAANEVEFDQAKLAEASIAGSHEAFEMLYVHYFPKVRNLCVRKLGNRELAEDVAQEAFARAFSRISQLGGPRNFGGWVTTIASNLCTDHLRKKRNTPLSLETIEHGPSYEVDPISDIARQEAAGVVNLAMRRLQPRHQQALMLHEVRGLSCAAVGEHLGISEAAAESLLARARRRLRKEVTAQAVPADLLGVGGLALVPWLVSGWRRALSATMRRIDTLQVAAARGTDAIGLSAMSSVEVAKALAIAVATGLALTAAVTSTTKAEDRELRAPEPVSRSVSSPTGPGPSSAESTGSAGRAADAQQPAQPNDPQPVSGYWDHDSRTGGIATTVTPPSRDGSDPVAKVDLHTGVALSGVPSIDVGVAVTDADDRTVLDTSDVAPALP